MSDQANWVDYKAIKHAVTIAMVLERYGISLRKSGKPNELAGACPFHQQSGDKSRPFTANTEKNNFHCFNKSCGVKGNQVDLVAKLEQCTFHNAALKLKEWFPAEYTTTLAALGLSEPAPESGKPEATAPKWGSGDRESKAVVASLFLRVGHDGQQPIRDRARELLDAHPWIKYVSICEPGGSIVTTLERE